MPVARTLIPALCLASLAPLAVTAESSANPLDRDRDPLVLAGFELTGLLGSPPERIVAFRYEGGWVQIPVQVDEKAVVDFGTIYGSTPSGYTVLTYTDTTTFTGPDPDPEFDADDELCLLGRDAGELSAAASEPPAVVPGTGIELTVFNPLNGMTAFVYLFESDGTLDPGAGADPIDYQFNLLSGNYRATYNTMSGPNPEDSRLTTASYSVHFADRWIRDETAVTAGNASGVDILDRHKALFAPGICARSEETFSAGEGAFITNRTGPVRALRGYVGANSGPTTYRIHTFYAEREELFTALRVHAISGIMDFFDYSPEASGMIFRNDLNPAGVTIDGVPDQVALGEFLWEMVTGDQGTLVMAMLINTDIPNFDYSSYYSDDVTPPTRQCTGDDFEYGASGFREDEPIPNTDPALGTFNIYEATRVMVYDSPGQNSAYAEARSLEALNPLTATAAPYTPSTAVAGPHRAPALGRLAISPNPLRGAARVSFALPETGAFTLRIYNARGRAIATLADGTWTGGAHRIRWQTSSLPAGVYFARATIAGHPETMTRILRLP
jgi:hypothetical protein